MTDGVLHVGGVDVRELAQTYGTPLFVCDEADLRSRCADYRDAFGPDAGVFYAAKAFCSKAVLRWVSDEGLGLDVCTGGELEVALAAGFPPERITLHGNNKSLAELDPGRPGRGRAHRARLVRGDRAADPGGRSGRDDAARAGRGCWSG